MMPQMMYFALGYIKCDGGRQSTDAKTRVRLVTQVGRRWSFQPRLRKSRPL